MERAKRHALRSSTALMALIERRIGLFVIFLFGITGLNIAGLVLLPFTLTHNAQAPLFYIMMALIMIELIALGVCHLKQIKDLHALNQHLEEDDRFKQQLLLMLNHEVRTPLSAVKGYVELVHMHGNQLTEERKTRYMEQISKACDEATSIISSIADSVRPGDQPRDELQKIPLEELIQAVIASLVPRILEEQRQLELALEPIEAFARPLKLRQVLRNLLTNAMNYSAHGTPLQVAITLQPYVASARGRAGTAPSNRIYIAVKDRGVGITPADQQRLFQPFSRLEIGQELSPRGNGLGLFLCKQMIESMNGDIWIESAGVPGQGTTVWISLSRA